MKKLISQNYKKLKILLRCMGLVISIIWMTKEWAWFIFLTLFLFVEILSLTTISED